MPTASLVPGATTPDDEAGAVEVELADVDDVDAVTAWVVDGGVAVLVEAAAALELDADGELLEPPHPVTASADAAFALRSCVAESVKAQRGPAVHEQRAFWKTMKQRQRFKAHRGGRDYGHIARPIPR